MQNWQVALLVISAIFLGMWIPLSLQLVATLRSGRRFVVTMNKRAEQTLTEVSTVKGRADGSTSSAGNRIHLAA